MKIFNQYIDAGTAADQFAREAFPGEKRRVGTIVVGNGLPVMMTFRLVDGRKWYTVTMLPNYAGWEITEEALQTV